MMQVERRTQTTSTKVLGDFHSAISSLASMLGSAKSAASEYGQSLHNYRAKIPESANDSLISSIVNALLQATGKMAEQNNALETHLNDASQHVSALGLYLEMTKKEATLDGLTGLANRQTFDKQIVASMEDAMSDLSPLTLLMIDIDHFKKINDTHGHVTGDQVIRLVSSVLLNNIKRSDLAARYGGEEFAIILPRTPVEGGRNVAEMLRRAVESRELINRGNGEKLGRVTLSAGLAQYRPGETALSFIERADAALYQAKKTGRNRVCAG
jgi:diguanylate cyclase